MFPKNRLILVAATVLLAIALCGSLQAANKALSQSGNVRIGYVDFDKALNSVSDGLIAKRRMKDEFKEKQRKLNGLQSKLTKMKNEIDNDRSTLSPSALKSREEKYRNKFFELQQMLTSFRAEMESRETHLTQKILKRLKNVVRDLGKQEGYSLILEKSQDVVLYAPTGEDLTNRVIKAYNRSSKK